ncbi:hypothetical protein BG015_004381 [Linnemannia schmuckeri]|uniref:Uncharacterized protein n=1 Tax=Linnemannia schmuckeri TaxID=64567 RepID=A0A9P5VCT8_9FUNG|nr:hypothetical protein BG015_004381 [Linnemannia schmuckeri]
MIKFLAALDEKHYDPANFKTQTGQRVFQDLNINFRIDMQTIFSQFPECFIIQLQTNETKSRSCATCFVGNGAYKPHARAVKKAMLLSAQDFKDNNDKFTINYIVNDNGKLRSLAK